MLHSGRKLAFALALLAIVLVTLGTTADLLPHQHNSTSERVCPLCHPTLAGMQPADLELPSLSNYSWTVIVSEYLSVSSTTARHSPPRAPPA